MPQHGDTNNETKKIYCGYWMTAEEWDDIHNYNIDENTEESFLRSE
jgi:hypothetical protein